MCRTFIRATIYEVIKLTLTTDIEALDYRQKMIFENEMTNRKFNRSYWYRCSLSWSRYNNNITCTLHSRSDTVRECKHFILKYLLFCLFLMNFIFILKYDHCSGLRQWHNSWTQTSRVYVRGNLTIHLLVCYHLCSVEPNCLMSACLWSFALFLISSSPCLSFLVSSSSLQMCLYSWWALIVDG